MAATERRPPVSLRLAPEMEDRLRDEADSLDLTLSEYLRRRILNGGLKAPLPATSEDRKVLATK